MGAGKSVGFLGLVVLSAVLGMMIFNATQGSSHQRLVAKGAPLQPNEFSRQQLAERLAAAIRFKTISFEDRQQIEKKEFEGLISYLEESFPRVHATLELQRVGRLIGDPIRVSNGQSAEGSEGDQGTTVGKCSLLYVWKGAKFGTDEDRAFLLTSHTDVVPVPESTLDKWDVDPFEGFIDDTHIWGRGSIDDKQGVLGMLEAVEWLIKDGFQPTNTLFLAFGHDEEIGGRDGASELSYAIQQSLPEGKKLSFLLDEGMAILNGGMPGLEDDAITALVAVAEKGSLTVDLVVDHPGGHSSMPPQHSAIGILSEAITKLENNPHPILFSSESPFRMMLEHMAPDMTNFGYKVLMSNLWFSFPMKAVIASDQFMAPSVRTTTAVTIVSGGTKANVLPTQAVATVNHRIVPGDSVATVLERDAAIINDPRVQLRKREGWLEPSPVSSCESDAFGIVEVSVKQSFGNSLVVPAVMIANTDSRHYWDVAEDIYRFCPTVLRKSELSMFHGINERIAIDNYVSMIEFYYRLIRNAQDPAATVKASSVGRAKEDL